MQVLVKIKYFSGFTYIISSWSVEFIGGILYTSHSVKVGDQVLILRPAYVMGKVGVVCGMESSYDSQANTRWIIQIPSENMVVSLTRDEFETLSPGFK